MKIAIVDDTREDAEALERIVSEEFEKKHVRNYSIVHFSTGEDFIDSWHTGDFSLIMLDIYMNGLTGLDVARIIRKTDDVASIVFFTSSNEFASESYDVGAAYYLHKPLQPDKIAAMINKINLDEIKKKRFIVLPDDTRIILRDIMYTEKYLHNIIFHIRGQSPKIIRMNHRDVEDILLTNPEFYTTSQSNVLNFSYVKNISKAGFLMKNEVLIPIPRRRYKELEERYKMWKFEKMISEDLY